MQSHFCLMACFVRYNVLLDSLIRLEYLLEFLESLVDQIAEQFKGNKLYQIRELRHKHIVNISKFKLARAAAEFLFGFSNSKQQPLFDLCELSSTRKLEKFDQEINNYRNSGNNSNNNVSRGLQIRFLYFSTKRIAISLKSDGKFAKKSPKLCTKIWHLLQYSRKDSVITCLSRA